MSFEQSVDISLNEVSVGRDKWIQQDRLLLDLVKQFKITNYPTQSNTCGICLYEWSPVVIKVCLVVGLIWSMLHFIKRVQVLFRTTTARAVAIVVMAIFSCGGK